MKQLSNRITGACSFLLLILILPVAAYSACIEEEPLFCCDAGTTPECPVETAPILLEDSCTINGSSGMPYSCKSKSSPEFKIHEGLVHFNTSVVPRIQRVLGISKRLYTLRNTFTDLSMMIRKFGQLMEKSDEALSTSLSPVLELNTVQDGIYQLVKAPDGYMLCERSGEDFRCHSPKEEHLFDFVTLISGQVIVGGSEVSGHYGIQERIFGRLPALVSYAGEVMFGKKTDEKSVGVPISLVTNQSGNFQPKHDKTPGQTGFDLHPSLFIKSF